MPRNGPTDRANANNRQPALAFPRPIVMQPVARAMEAPRGRTRAPSVQYDEQGARRVDAEVGTADPRWNEPRMHTMATNADADGSVSLRAPKRDACHGRQQHGPSRQKTKKVRRDLAASRPGEAAPPPFSPSVRFHSNPGTPNQHRQPQQHQQYQPYLHHQQHHYHQPEHVRPTENAATGTPQANQYGAISDTVRSLTVEHYDGAGPHELIEHVMPEAYSYAAQPHIATGHQAYQANENLVVPSSFHHQAFAEPYGQSRDSSPRIVILRPAPMPAQQLLVGERGELYLPAPASFQPNVLNEPFAPTLTYPSGAPGHPHTYSVMHSLPPTNARTQDNFSIVRGPPPNESEVYAQVPASNVREIRYIQPPQQRICVRRLPPTHFASQTRDATYRRPAPQALVSVSVPVPTPHARASPRPTPPTMAAPPTTLATTSDRPIEHKEPAQSDATVGDEHLDDQSSASSAASSPPLATEGSTQNNADDTEADRSSIPDPVAASQEKASSTAEIWAQNAGLPHFLSPCNTIDIDMLNPGRPGLYRHPDYELQLKLTKDFLSRDLESTSNTSPTDEAIPSVDSQMRELPRILCLLSDYKRLTPNQVLLRLQIEVFISGEHEPNVRSRGRNKPVAHGQVGMRCRHCKNLPLGYRGRGASYFPASIRGIYQAAQNMYTSHMQSGACSELPTEVIEEFSRLSTTKRSSSGAGKQYWAEAATRIGLVDTDRGIRFVNYLTPEEKQKLAKDGPPKLQIYTA